LRWARVKIVLEALETRRGMKADTPPGPFLKFAENVFGDEHDVCRAADEFVFGRFGLRDDKRENGGTVGRRDGDETFAGLEFGVVGEMEAELVHEEANAAVVVADEDVDALDAQVGVLRSGGSRAGGHGEIICEKACLPEREKWGTICSLAVKKDFAGLKPGTCTAPT